MKSIPITSALYLIVMFIINSDVVFAATNDTEDALMGANIVRLLSYTNQDRFYTCNTTYTNLKKTPRWNIDNDEPPLSVRSAILIAKSHERRLHPTDMMMTLSEVTLNNALGDFWFYDVRIKEAFYSSQFFGPGSSRERTGPPIDIVVLMDGTIAEPKEEILDPTGKRFVLKSN